MNDFQTIQVTRDLLTLDQPTHEKCNEDSVRCALAAYAHGNGERLTNGTLQGLITDLLVDLRHLADAVEDNGEKAGLYTRASGIAVSYYQSDLKGTVRYEKNSL